MLDIEVQGTIACLLHIVYLYAIVLASLHGNFLLSILNTLTGLPQVDDGVAIDQQANLIVAADSEDKGLVTRGNERSVETGREVLEIHTRSKDGIATIA